MNRVVVTGMGTVNPLGMNVNDSWKNLLSMQSGITDNGQLKIKDEISPRIGKFIHLSILATEEAIMHSNINEKILSEASIIVGSGIGGLEEIQKYSNILQEKSYIEEYGNDYRSTRSPISPYFIISSLINLAAGNISIKHKIRGESKAVVSACASGAHAIIDAARMIKLGEAKCVIVSGTEASACPIGLAGFSAMRALYNGPLPLQKASMPFDRNRNGFVMSEGAATLVIEDLNHALARKANIHAEIVSYGCSSDASHITKPNADGAVAAMKKALGNVRQKVCVNAHATSTPAGDESELNAIYDVFNDHEVYVTANKGAIGHTLGASGSIEAIFSILSLQNQIVPCTLNLNNSINTKDNIHISNSNVNTDIKYVLSNSFGFGGTNTSILFAKY